MVLLSVYFQNEGTVSAGLKRRKIVRTGGGHWRNAGQRSNFGPKFGLANLALDNLQRRKGGSLEFGEKPGSRAGSGAKAGSDFRLVQK